jgi:hypothetical protein
MQSFLNVKICCGYSSTVFKTSILKLTIVCRIFTECFCKECDVFPGIVQLLAQCSHVKVTVDIQLQVLEKRDLKMTEYSMQLAQRMNCLHILGK